MACQAHLDAYRIAVALAYPALDRAAGKRPAHAEALEEGLEAGPYSASGADTVVGEAYRIRAGACLVGETVAVERDVAFPAGIPCQLSQAEGGAAHHL